MRLEDERYPEYKWNVINVKVKPSKSNPGYSHARDQNGINYLVLNKHIAEHLEDFRWKDGYMRLEDKRNPEIAWTIISVKVKPSKSNPGYSHARDTNGNEYLVLNKYIAEHLDDFNVVPKV
jgi:hypothetical protein